MTSWEDVIRIGGGTAAAGVKHHSHCNSNRGLGVHTQSQERGDGMSNKGPTADDECSQYLPSTQNHTMARREALQERGRGSLTESGEVRNGQMMLQ